MKVAKKVRRVEIIIKLPPALIENIDEAIKKGKVKDRDTFFEYASQLFLRKLNVR